MSTEIKRALRTVLQCSAAFAVALPAIIGASGIPTSLPWVAGGLAVAGGTARVMALPTVQGWLGALRTDKDAR